MAYKSEKAGPTNPKLSATQQEYANSTSHESNLLHPQLHSLADLQIITED